TRDLGEVTLPFYDAKSKKYEIARTKLGSVEVRPGKAVAPAASAAPAASSKTEGPLEDLGVPRRTLGAPAATPRHFADSKGFFGLLAGGPLAVMALGGLHELAARLKKRYAARERSLTAASRRALAEARDAAHRGDKAAVAGAVERALYTAIEDRLGLKARAFLRPDLGQKLEKASVERALASDVVGLLDACDALRFSSAEDAAAKDVIERASRVIARLPRAARPAAPEQAA
ncbi:MAG TPA: hypothetical protein VHU80_14525, partial [Polyangiaceae bacterium]|nr:hypothetical protein [Polyangiaceae bacterium]